MAKTEKPWDAESHWLAQELLARYSELERAHIDASEIYPNVAAHLKQCDICRAVLEDLLAASPDDESPGRQESQQSRATAYEDERQEAWASRFQTRMVLPLAGVFDPPRADADFQPVRGSGSARSGGRLLFYDTVYLGGEQIIAKFILCFTEMPGYYLVAGELSGSALPAAFSACLYAGRDVGYETDVQQGKLSFENIPLDESIENLEVVLSLPTK